MKTVTVRTKKELEAAKKSMCDEIIVLGKMALMLHNSKGIVYLSGATLATITALVGVGTVAAPLTGGVSLAVAAVPIAAITGADLAAIIAILTIGITTLMAINKDYEEISFDLGKKEAKFKKKANV